VLPLNLSGNEDEWFFVLMLDRFENIYPGVRCDIPAHVYQSTFSPNIEWSEEYAQGREILDYWRSVAKKHHVYRYIRFRTKVTGAYWVRPCVVVIGWISD
jgi:cation diffusion facilitator CzcD-associated flavoprotein CzcO